MAIPRQYLIAYAVSNVAAVGILGAAFWRPRVARVLFVVLFLWASLTNATTAMRTPEVYVEYASLAISSFYRDFILGWFSEHVRLLVLPVALGQFIIAVLLMTPRPWRSLGVFGAVTFLVAIAPLGVGSAFPFSFTAGVALIVMDLKLAHGFRATREAYP
jgi:hypothetical protein